MTFSICIPNYNYARYLGASIRSALEQTAADLEVHVADNDSTDGSVAVLEAIADPRFSYDRNRCNVGFASNLDRAVSGTKGDWIILLSSDDLMKSEALETYQRVIDHLGGNGARLVISSTCEVIDGDGEPLGLHRPPDWCWKPADIDTTLSTIVGATTYRLAPAEVLQRSLSRVRNPVWFSSTAYPRALYDEIEGYRSHGLINPDKEFHWRLIAAADLVVFVDTPLFSYRVHDSNQGSQEVASGALKQLVDDYVLSFGTEDGVRERAGVTNDEMARCYVREDISKRALLALVQRDPAWARRAVAFGVAAYPELMRKDPLALLTRGLVATRIVSSPLLSLVGGTMAQRHLGQRRLIREGVPDGSV
jgi:glycosyltransferase involved in cell wall biosynthesis